MLSVGTDRSAKGRATLDVRKLHIFVTVVTSGSFSRAAKLLHMAQPPVSIAAKKLEQELGATLLLRSHNNIEMTAEGREVFEQAQKILAQMDELRHSVGEYKQLLRGEISVACPSMVGTYYLPQLLGEFLDLHPGLKASVTQAGTERIQQLLLSGKVDLGVVTLKQADSTLQVIPLLSERMVVCVDARHPLRKQSSVHISDLHRLPMVLYESDYFIRRRLDDLCAAADVSPDIRLQTNYLPLMTKMVKQNHGATVALGMMADQEPGLFSLPLIPHQAVDIGIAYRVDAQLGRANRRFVEWLEQR